MQVSWPVFKNLIIKNKLKMQYVDNSNDYYIWTINGSVIFEVWLWKSASDTTDLLDFEINFKNVQLDLIGTFYRSIDANSIETCPGFTVPLNLKYAISRFRANGADPNSYVSLIWDYNGASEKVIVSTKGDIDLYFDTSFESEYLIGDGVKKLVIVITNNNDTATPIIGGSFELIKVY